jgi:hypothetical protein
VHSSWANAAEENAKSVIVTIPSIATSLRKKYNKWLFMSRRPNQNRPVPNSSTARAAGSRRSGIGAKVMRPPTEAAYGEESHELV